MKIELTEDEANYLADKTFWDWKRAEIDVWQIKLFNLPKKRAKKILANEAWYKNLYLKLGGKELERKEDKCQE